MNDPNATIGCYRPANPETPSPRNSVRSAAFRTRRRTAHRWPEHRYESPWSNARAVNRGIRAIVAADANTPFLWSSREIAKKNRPLAPKIAIDDQKKGRIGSKPWSNFREQPPTTDNKEVVENAVTRSHRGETPAHLVACGTLARPCVRSALALVSHAAQQLALLVLAHLLSPLLNHATHNWLATPRSPRKRGELLASRREVKPDQSGPRRPPGWHPWAASRCSRSRWRTPAFGVGVHAEAVTPRTKSRSHPLGGARRITAQKIFPGWLSPRARTAGAHAVTNVSQSRRGHNGGPRCGSS